MAKRLNTPGQPGPSCQMRVSVPGGLVSVAALPTGHVRSSVGTDGIPADATVVTDADKVEPDEPEAPVPRRSLWLPKGRP